MVMSLLESLYKFPFIKMLKIPLRQWDRDAATLAVIEKVRVSAACFLSRAPRPSPCSILFTALFLRSLLSSALLSLLAVPGP